MAENRSFIAVVDDDESMCQALGRLLRLAGYDARTYFSAEAFLEDPDRARTGFLVADIELRGMSGFDLHRRLGQERTGLPVAFITAHDEAATRAHARDAGCVAYLRKPFSGSALIDAVANAIGHPPGGIERREPSHSH